MLASNTVEESRAPVPIRLLNKGGAALGKIGLGSKPLAARKLLDAAKRRCQLGDFGDGEFLDALSRLLEAAHREAHLNVIGKMALRNDVGTLAITSTPDTELAR